MRTPTTVLAERYIIQYTCPLNTGERTIWFKQFSLFCNLLDKSSSDTVFLELYERTADLTGTSRATVERIKQATDKGDAPRIPVKKTTCRYCISSPQENKKVLSSLQNEINRSETQRENCMHILLKLSDFIGTKSEFVIKTLGSHAHKTLPKLRLVWTIKNVVLCIMAPVLLIYPNENTI